MKPTMNQNQQVAMNTTTDAKLDALRLYDPCYSVLHGCRVRFLRWDDVDYLPLRTYAAVADNDGRELPDLVHRTQLRTY
jgi:hypothetical protein